MKTVVGYIVALHHLRAVGACDKEAAWNTWPMNRHRVWVFPSKEQAQLWIDARRSNFPKVARAPYRVIPIVKHEPSNVDPAPQN